MGRRPNHRMGPLAATTVTALVAVITPAPPSSVEPSAGEAASADAQPPPVEALLERVRELQGEDMKAWHRYRFRRDVTKETIDDEGKVDRRETRELLLTPEADGGFRELLVSLDGHEPSRRAVEQSLRERDFTRKYRALVDKGSGQIADRGFNLDQILDLTGPVLAGVERIDGAECWRIDFHPVPEERVSGGRIADLIRQAMEGSLWVTRKELHVVRARARTVRPVPIFWILAKVYALEVAMDQAEVGAGVWLPTRISLDLDRRIVFDRGRTRSTWTYSEHERVE